MQSFLSARRLSSSTDSIREALARKKAYHGRSCQVRAASPSAVISGYVRISNRPHAKGSFKSPLHAATAARDIRWVSLRRDFALYCFAGHAAKRAEWAAPVPGAVVGHRGGRGAVLRLAGVPFNREIVVETGCPDEASRWCHCCGV